MFVWLDMKEHISVDATLDAFEAPVTEYPAMGVCVQWLAKFRGVSKHHLQGHLNFCALLLNDDADWFSKILGYESSG